jgi:hypothetical protein
MSYNPPPLPGHVWLRKRHTDIFHYHNLAGAPIRAVGFSLCGQRLNWFDIDDHRGELPPIGRRCLQCRQSQLDLTGGNPFFVRPAPPL